MMVSHPVNKNGINSILREAKSGSQGKGTEQETGEQSRGLEHKVPRIRRAPLSTPYQLAADSPPSEVTQGAERVGLQHPTLRGWEEGSRDFQSMAMAN